VVAAAIQEASLRAQIEAQLQIVSLNRQALEIIRNQLKIGYVSEADVRNQEMTCALAQQALVPLQQQLEKTRDLLRVLAGDTSAEEYEDPFTLESLQLPEDLPLSLTSKLILQRPDVRIAESQLYSAGTLYGVVVDKTLPHFTITGAIGGMATSPTWLIKAGGVFFDMNTNVTQAIFDGTTLRGQSRAELQVLTHVGTQYRNVVMAALQNVTDVLYIIQYDAQALKAAATVAQAASKMGELTRKQYESGAVDFQTMLVVQQNEQSATVNLLQAQTNHLGDAAALFQALGGGWWGREMMDKAQVR
jgi:outer membrane protein TolC